MPSQHKHNPLRVRPPEALRDWLLAYAERAGKAVNAVVTEALEDYRAKREKEEQG